VLGLPVWHKLISLGWDCPQDIIHFLINIINIKMLTITYGPCNNRNVKEQVKTSKMHTAKNIKQKINKKGKAPPKQSTFAMIINLVLKEYHTK
jgi:hypothetical protein